MNRHHPHATRHLDYASVALLLTGLITLTFTIAIAITRDIHPVLAVTLVAPSLGAIRLGARNLTKWIAPRDHRPRPEGPARP